MKSNYANISNLLAPLYNLIHNLGLVTLYTISIITILNIFFNYWSEN